MSHDARRDAMRDARSTQPPPPPRRFCPRCGAALGALAAPAVDGSADGVRPGASALYCGCCGLVVPAS